jgi:hypothetical protein
MFCYSITTDSFREMSNGRWWARVVTFERGEARTPVLAGLFAVREEPGYETVYYPLHRATAERCQRLYHEGMVYTTAGGFMPGPALSVRYLLTRTNEERTATPPSAHA